MKIIFNLIFCLTLSLSALSQDQNDTSKNKVHFVNYAFGLGLNVTNYYSDIFFHYVFEKYYKPACGSLSGGNCYFKNKTGNQSTIVNGGHLIHPQDKNYTAFSIGPALNFALELRSNKIKNVFHVFSANFLRTQTEYSCYSGYHEDGQDGLQYWSSDITDTSRLKFSQNNLSLGYKLRAGFKKMFLGLGINFSLNYIYGRQYSSAFINGVSGGETLPINYSRYQNTDQGISNIVVTSPFSIESGINIKIGKYILRPTLNFSTAILKKYNCYMISLELLPIR